MHLRVATRDHPEHPLKKRRLDDIGLHIMFLFAPLFPPLAVSAQPEAFVECDVEACEPVMLVNALDSPHVLLNSDRQTTQLTPR